MTDLIFETPRPAGFWIRALALLIDGLVLSVPFTLMGLSSPHATVAQQCITTGLGILYLTVLLSCKLQATVGERMLGIYVGDAQTMERLSLWRALKRSVLFYGPALFLLLAGPPDAMPQNLSPQEQQQLALIIEKVQHQEPLTVEDARTFNDILLQKLATAQEREKISPLVVKMNTKEGLTLEEKKTFQDFVVHHFSSPKGMFEMAISILGAVYAVVMGLMVGLTQQKTGPHDLLSGTRVAVGRAKTTEAQPDA